MSERYRSALLFGSPGVGKGTQGRLIGQIPGFYHMASGDIFRSLDKESEIGQKFQEYSSKGLLVPDELTIDMWRGFVEEKIAEGAYSPDRDLLLLDGLPRSVAQAHMMAENVEVLSIIHIKAPNIDMLVNRMKLRAEREGRIDDADEAVIRRRFEVYEAETSPVLNEYDLARVTHVHATGTPAEVLLRILESLVPIYCSTFTNPLD